MHTCKDCGATLTEANWSPSYTRDRIYLCRPCAVARTATYEKAHPSRRQRYNAAYYRKHPDKIRKAAKKYYEANRDTPEFRERSKVSRQRYNVAHRDVLARRQKRWRQRHLVRLAATAKAKREALRKEALEAYGHACACCGETRPEFLAIDHTNGDGAAHRREMSCRGKNVGAAIYLWLKKRGFPKDRFRLLCHNCNMARGFYGYCPHEREREATA